MALGNKYLKERLLNEMRAYFGSDDKRIDHACRVLEYSEKLMEREPADRDIVTAAAVLHDIGIHEAERKYGSTAGKYQQIEGPPIAKKILEEIDFPKEKTEEVLGIIARHHSPRKEETQNFKILYDSDWLVNLPGEADLNDGRKVEQLIGGVFLTSYGRQIAENLFLK